MPYINSKDDRREKLVKGCKAKNAGELNFQMFSFIKHCPDSTLGQVIFDQIKKYTDSFLGVKSKRKYQNYNDLTGALHCCYNEILRRLGFKLEILKDVLGSYDLEISAYENLKIKQNGDVE